MAKKTLQKMENKLGIVEEKVDPDKAAAEVDALLAEEGATVIRKEKKKKAVSKLIEDDEPQTTSDEVQMATPVQQRRPLDVEQSVRLFEPIAYSDAEAMAQALVNQQIVYVQLTRLQTVEANRIIDFLTGVVYGLRGDIQRVSANMFICTPQDVEITEALLNRFD